MTSFRARNQLASWWARRWLDALSLLETKRQGPTYSYGWNTPNHREEGFTLARTGHVFDATIEGTTARAHVVDRRYRTHPAASCSLTLAAFDEATWAQLVTVLGARTQVEAALLSGEMPLQVEALVATAGVSLFPRQAAELRATCDGYFCEGLCQHVSALHYALGDMLERDPFVLFELRGRPRARLLAELRAHRRAGSVAAPLRVGVPLSDLLEAGYDDARAGLPVPPSPAGAPGRLVDTLRTLAGWSEPSSPALLLGPAIDEAARLATELLAPVPSSRPRRPGATGPLGRRDEAILRRAQQLAQDEPALAAALPTLVAVSLGLDARRGAPAGAVLEAFEALRPRGPSALAAWHERWTREELERPGELLLGLGEVQVGARRAGILWRLDADRPRPVRWWSETGSLAQRAPLRRRAIEATDTLVSRDRTVTLVAELEACGAPTWDFLTAIGWDAVLRCPADEPVALPGVEPQPLDLLMPAGAELPELTSVQLPRLGIHARRLVMTRAEGALHGVVSDWTAVPAARLLSFDAMASRASSTLDLDMAPERRLAVTSDLWMPWLTLFLVTHELLEVLGEASEEAVGSGHARRGASLFASLPTMADEQARSWLRRVVQRLGEETTLTSWSSA